MDVASLIHSEPLPPTLKRRASSTFDIDDEPSSSSRSSSSRKRLREEGDGNGSGSGAAPPAVDGAALADELEQELQCGCCAAVVYRPVVVSPCQHFFCGRCVPSRRVSEALPC